MNLGRQVDVTDGGVVLREVVGGARRGGGGSDRAYGSEGSSVDGGDGGVVVEAISTDSELWALVRKVILQ